MNGSTIRCIRCGYYNWITRRRCDNCGRILR